MSTLVYYRIEQQYIYIREGVVIEKRLIGSILIGGVRIDLKNTSLNATVKM